MPQKSLSELTAPVTAWYSSNDEDVWHGGPYDSREEAEAEAEAGMRALLRTGCDLLADEYDNLKASITMPDGSLSANPLDAWAVEKVAAVEDWIASVKATLYPVTPEAEGGCDA